MEEIKYPLSFTSCPNCGSTRTIANEILKGEKAKGRAGEDVVAFLFQHRSVIADLSRVLLSAPLVVTFYDTCVDCGAVYCVHADLGTAVPGVEQQQPPAGGTFSKS